MPEGRNQEGQNTQVLLRRRPDAVPKASDFDVVSTPIPIAGEGEVFCKTHYLSLDPYMRGQINGRHISGAIHPGELMRGETVSEIITSGHKDFKFGQMVKHQGGWQEYSVAKPGDLQLVDPRIDPPSLALGILGMPGLNRLCRTFKFSRAKSGRHSACFCCVGRSRFHGWANCQDQRLPRDRYCGGAKKD